MQARTTPPAVARLQAAELHALRHVAAALAARPVAAPLVGAPGRWRAVAVGADDDALSQALGALARGRAHPALVVAEAAPAPPKVGFLVGGRGRERAQAGEGLVGLDVAFTEAVSRALAGRGREDLAALRAPLELWQDPHVGKLLLGALDLGLAAALAARGVRPVAVLGYSVGELVAAALAGVFGADDAMALLDEAGESERRHAVPGGMLWVKGPEAQVCAAVAGLPEAWLAAENGHEIFVISGSPSGLEAARAALRGLGLRPRDLPLASPVHCPLMRDVAADGEASAARVTLAPPACPWVSTVTGTLVQAADPAHWGRLAVSPARFREAWEEALTLGVDLWVELGPAPSLSLLAGVDAPVLAALHDRLPEPLAWERLLGWLWCHGVPLTDAPSQLAPPPEVDAAGVDALPNAAGTHAPGGLDLPHEPPSQAPGRPRTPTERLLAGVWGEVLGVSAVGLRDHFFELGGDSAAAARAVELAGQRGLELSLRALFTQPELGRLADTLDGAEAPARCLVLLRDGRPDAPVVCVPGMGGSAQTFRELVNALGPGPAVWGLDAPEVAGRPESPEDLPGLARLFAEELIEALPPAAPLRLVGYSLGAALGAELARQLRAAGRSVRSLLMLDPAPPAFSDTLPPRRPQGFLREQLGVRDEEVAGLDTDELISLLARRLAGQDTPRAGRGWEEELRRIDAATLANRARCRGWRARSPGVPVTLLFTDGNAEVVPAWAETLGEPPRLARIGGGHFSALTREHAPALAREVEAWLGEHP